MSECTQEENKRFERVVHFAGMKQWVSGLVTRSPIQGRSRAIVKTAGYRLFMVLITFAVALVFTNDFGQALNIGIVTNVAKTGTYYAYERLWDRISWGIDPSATN
jgi:uncharacterized membrane protein